MRKWIALLLLACFGMIIPVAAVPVRICLLDAEERAADCCQACDAESQDCCADLDGLPDSPLPGHSLELPPFVGVEVPFFEIPGPRETTLCLRADRLLPPVRGPDSPSAFRAVLGVWRL